MEENIEILQNFINEDWNCKYTLTKVKQSAENILAELEKKDKIIEEMAKFLGDLKLSKDREGYEIMEVNDWKQYFKKKVEEDYVKRQ